MNTQINIPIEIFDGVFSLEEIAVICIIMSCPHQSPEVLDFWNKDVSFNNTMNKLISKGVIEIEGDKLEVNVSNLIPEVRNLGKKFGLSPDILESIQTLIEDLSQDSYCEGYEDGRIDYQPFTSYGKTEDY